MDSFLSFFDIDWAWVPRVAWPTFFVLSGWVLGALLERIAVGRLRLLAARTSWEGDDIFIEAFRGLVRWVGALVGLHLALLRWPVSADAGHWLRNGTLIVAVLVATVFASRAAVGLVKLSTRRVEGVAPSMTIFHSITRVAVFAMGILIALQSVGISIAPILTALGVGGLATALALQPTLANLFSGIQILASRTIKPGDFIRLGTGEEGSVTDISWRITTIRTPTNNLVLVPNAKLADAVVTNFHGPDLEVPVVVPVSVAYGSDLQKVEAVSIAAAREVQESVEGAIRGFEPLVRFSALQDSDIAFNVILRVNIQEWGRQGLVRHEFLKKLVDAYRREGIEIPYPHRVMIQKD
jgi:small-conductance mechanosensitive channel